MGRSSSGAYGMYMVDELADLGVAFDGNGDDAARARMSWPSEDCDVI
jgi:hypothetical protein